MKDMRGVWKMSRLSCIACALYVAFAAGTAFGWPQLYVERDWMSGYKPSCTELGEAMHRCGWDATIHDDDSTCTFYEYLDSASPSVYGYLENYENDSVPAGQHKVHILGSKYSNASHTYYGICFRGSHDSDQASTCVAECGAGTAKEKHNNNHEIGHEFEISGSCTVTSCCMYDCGTGYYFCTTGPNHANTIRNGDP